MRFVTICGTGSPVKVLFNSRTVEFMRNENTEGQSAKNWMCDYILQVKLCWVSYFLKNNFKPLRDYKAKDVKNNI